MYVDPSVALWPKKTAFTSTPYNHAILTVTTVNTFHTLHTADIVVITSLVQL